MKMIFAATILFATLARADVDSTQITSDTNENIQAQIKLEHPNVISFSILPSATDPAIKNFDNPHWMYVNRDIVVEHKADLAQDRHELYLFIPGTHEKGSPR